MLYFKINDKKIPALTREQFEAKLAGIKKFAEIEEIEVGIVSGKYNGVRYYAMDPVAGVDVIEPNLDEWEMFWEYGFDSNVFSD